MYASQKKEVNARAPIGKRAGKGEQKQRLRLAGTLKETSHASFWWE
jgi:hypothetical protein